MSATDNDFVVGFDPTGYTSISGAQLGQLVNSAAPYTDKGLVIITEDQGGVPDVPDAGTTTKWKRYLWLRVSPLTTSIALYAWNPAQLFNIGYSDGSTDFVASNWNPVTISAIPAASILGYMIANGTITKEKIVSIDVSQIENFNSDNYVLTTSSPNASGDISGSFAVGLAVKNEAITLAKLNATEGTDHQVLVNQTATSVVWKNVWDLLQYATQKAAPLATDEVPIIDNANGGVGKRGTIASLVTGASTASAEAALAPGTLMFNITHGLSFTPRVRGVLVCQAAGTTQCGYAAGDEIPIECVSNEATQRPVFVLASNGTKVMATMVTQGSNQLTIPTKTAGVYTNVGYADGSWKLKLYYGA